MCCAYCALRPTSPHAPALVEIALSSDFAHLDRGPECAVGGRGEIGRAPGRHLLLVRTVDECLCDGAAVERRQVGVAIKPHQRDQRRRNIHVAHRRVYCDTALEIDAPGQEGVMYGPGAHAAVIAGVAFERPGGAAGVGVIGAGHAEGVLGRTPWESENDIGTALGVVEMDELRRECAWLDAFDRGL